MTLMLIAILLGAVLTVPASAAPGDPRLVQGTLEWPTTLTREPVFIVRGDDGQVYFCEITESVRQRPDGLRAGGRISVLGLEAARPHELTTIVIGTGDAAALALALSRATAKSAAGDAAASTPSTPAPTVTPPATGPQPSTTPTAPVLAAAPPPSAAPTVIIMAPASNATPPPPGVAPPAAIVPAAVATAPAVPPLAVRRVGSPATLPGGRGQWSRLDGMVESVAGSMLTLKMDDGAVAYVDISQLNPSVAQILRSGHRGLCVRLSAGASVRGGAVRPDESRRLGAASSRAHQSLNGSAARRGRRLAAAMVPTCA